MARGSAVNPATNAATKTAGSILTSRNLRTTSVCTAIDAAMASGDYDAVLGDREASVGTYREFVVFSEDLIYPEYFILYTRESKDAAVE